MRTAQGVGEIFARVSAKINHVWRLKVFCCRKVKPLILLGEAGVGKGRDHEKTKSLVIVMASYFKRLV